MMVDFRRYFQGPFAHRSCMRGDSTGQQSGDIRCRSNTREGGLPIVLLELPYPPDSASPGDTVLRSPSTCLRTIGFDSLQNFTVVKHILAVFLHIPDPDLYVALPYSSKVGLTYLSESIQSK